MFSKLRLIGVIFAGMLLASSAAFAQGESQTDNRPSKLEATLYRASQVAWISGTTLDSWTTVTGINNPVKVTYHYCQDGTQECQFPVGVERTTTFREIGSPSWFGFQESGTIVVATAAIEAGIQFANYHLLYKKGGWRTKLAIGINFVMAGTHTTAGIINAVNIRNAHAVPAGAFSVTRP